MGWRFRKSKNFGPFRINFSKSGIGYSFGGKGFRITKTANERIRQTVSIPGTGISYVTETKRGKRADPPKQPIVLTEKQKRNLKNNSVIVRFFLLFIIIIMAVAAWAVHYETTVQTDYTPEQLLTLDGHPKLYDTTETAEGFYSQLEDSRIKLADYSWISKKQSDIKSYADDKIVLYLAKNEGYIREAIFNLKENDFGRSLDISTVFGLVGSYLPLDLLEVYKTDATCIHSNEEATQYIYCGRLNGEAAPPQYGYYLSIRATNFSQDGLWRVEVMQEAYGGRSVEWIEKYTTPWDFDLSQYVN